MTLASVVSTSSTAGTSSSSASASTAATASTASNSLSTSAERESPASHGSPRVEAAAVIATSTHRTSPRRGGTSAAVASKSAATGANVAASHERSISPGARATNGSHRATPGAVAAASTNDKPRSVVQQISSSPNESARVSASTRRTETPVDKTKSAASSVAPTESDSSNGNGYSATANHPTAESADSVHASTVRLVRFNSHAALTGASVIVTEPMVARVTGTTAALTHTNSKICANCQHAFSLFELRHTCKLCRRRLCDLCSKNRIKLNRRLERKKGSRLCDRCAQHYLQTHTTDATALSATEHGADRTGSSSTVVQNESLDTRAVDTPKDPPAVASTTLMGSPRPGQAMGLVEPSTTGETDYKSTASSSSITTSCSSFARKFSMESANLSATAMAMAAGSMSASQSSHLRRRHWVSFCVWGLLIVLRIWCLNDAPSALASASLWRHALGHRLQQLVNLRCLGLYFLVLIAIDEVGVVWQHHTHGSGSDADNSLTKTRPNRPGSSSSLVVTKPSSLRHRSPSSSGSNSGGVAVRVASRRFRTRSRLSSSNHLQSQRSNNAPLEALEVDTSENINRDSQSFHIDKLITALHVCLEEVPSPPDEPLVAGVRTAQRMEMVHFLGACESICLFVLVFGRATSFAASTVQGYMDSIRNNLMAWPMAETCHSSPSSSSSESSSKSPAGTWLNASVRQVIEREVANGTAAIGGKKKPSCTRCVLRLLWFVQFVEACMRYTLVENLDEDCVAGATKAYEETIGSRHAWIIRKGVTSALGTMPKRRAILSALRLTDAAQETGSSSNSHSNSNSNSNSNSDHALQKVQQVNALMQELVDQVTQVLKEHHLLDVK